MEDDSLLQSVFFFEAALCALSLFGVSLFGQLGQAGISLSYYAKQDRDLDGLFQGWAVNQGYNIGWNQLKEFTPDLNAFIRRHSKKKHQAPTDPRAPAAATGTN